MDKDVHNKVCKFDHTVNLSYHDYQRLKAKEPLGHGAGDPDVFLGTKEAKSSLIRKTHTSSLLKRFGTLMTTLSILSLPLGKKTMPRL